MKKQELGYISIWRQIKDKGWYRNSKYVHLWVHILLCANHKPKEFLWNKKMIKIKEGQFITGRKQLSAETGLQETTIENILKCFENEHQIGQQKTTKFRLITVLNWEEFQRNEHQIGQQSDNRVTTNGQQNDTNNNEITKNNDNKDNNLYNKQLVNKPLTQVRLGKVSNNIFFQPTIEEVKKYCEERKNGINAEGFIDYYTSKGWMIGKNKMKDWQASIRTWERNNKEKGNILNLN